jgi:hypothetical protein
VLDLFNKEVIGYSVSKTADSELVKRALSNALVNTQRSALQDRDSVIGFVSLKERIPRDG